MTARIVFAALLATTLLLLAAVRRTGSPSGGLPGQGQHGRQHILTAPCSERRGKGGPRRLCVLLRRILAFVERLQVSLAART